MVASGGGPGFPDSPLQAPVTHTHARARPRLLAGPALTLHDVRDVEAHVRTLLDSQLGRWGARLDAELYDDALTFLLTKCWELSGLAQDGTARRVWYVDVYDQDPDDAPAPVQTFGPFANELKATDVGSNVLDRQPQMIVGFRDSSAPGAYDPDLGLSFSTYSRRILESRLVDWYRKTFGDARYANRRREVSLDSLTDFPDRAGSDESYLERAHDPGSVLDELNRHAAVNPMEEVIDRVSVPRRP